MQVNNACIQVKTSICNIHQGMKVYLMTMLEHAWVQQGYYHKAFQSGKCNKDDHPMYKNSTALYPLSRKNSKFYEKDLGMTV